MLRAARHAGIARRRAGRSTRRSARRSDRSAAAQHSAGMAAGRFPTEPARQLAASAPLHERGGSVIAGAVTDAELSAAIAGRRFAQRDECQREQTEREHKTTNSTFVHDPYSVRRGERKRFSPHGVSTGPKPDRHGSCECRHDPQERTARSLWTVKVSNGKKVLGSSRADELFLRLKPQASHLQPSAIPPPVRPCAREPCCAPSMPGRSPRRGRHGPPLAGCRYRRPISRRTVSARCCRSSGRRPSERRPR